MASSSQNSLKLAFAIARRELRGSLGRFRVFLIALTLGVTAIGAVGSIASSMRHGIAVNSRLLFGGDLEASSTHKPLPQAVLSEMKNYGQTSSMIQMRAMLSGGADNALQRRLVSLKAVDENWPLIGTPRLDPPISIAQALKSVNGNPGIVANAGVLRVLGAEVGDTIRLGDIDVHVGAILLHQPDRDFGFDQFAPSAIIADENLDATGLNIAGALLTYRQRLLLNQPSQDEAALEVLRGASENSLVRLRHHRQGSAGLQAFLDRTETFLTLVSLTALLIGGLGVSSAVRAWLMSRMSVLATLKSLGASAALIFRIYFIQVLILTTLGVGIGLTVAVIAPWLVSVLLGAVLPVPIAVGIFPTPLLAAASFGFLTAIAFSVWPLGKARDVNPSQLFRTLITAPGGWPRKRYLAIVALAILGLVVLTWKVTTSPVLAFGFMGGVVAVLILLAGLGDIVVRVISRLPQSRFLGLNLALGAVVRPGNSTRAVIITFGLGLAVLVAIAVSEFNMSRQINARLADDAPSWFFIDIQPQQKAPFLATTAELVGEENIVMVPMVRGRVVAMAGVAAEDIDAPPSEEWILSGDRGLTWASELPGNAKIASGTWWPKDYQGDLQVSMDHEAMLAFGLNLGDSVIFNIAGRELNATITSSRHIEWQTFGLNFVFVLSPGAVESAPHNWVATVAADDLDLEAEVDRRIAAIMPNVSSISVREAVATASRILNLVSIAIQITAGITLIAGFAVLAGTVAASEARRINTSIILKVLGATRRVILASYLYEYALLGLITGLVAVIIGTAAGYGVITLFLESDFVFPAGLTIAVALGGAAATMVLGLAGASRTLGLKPGPILRAN